MEKVTDWIVRAYQDEREVDSWRIENRTESQAEREAAADVHRLDCNDWTLTESE